MARLSASMSTEFVFATGEDGREIEIFRRDNPPASDIILHRTVDTIVDLRVGNGAAPETPRARVLVTSFGIAGKKSTAAHFVRETPDELSRILAKFDVDPEMWDNSGSVNGLIARITGRGRRGAHAHI